MIFNFFYSNFIVQSYPNKAYFYVSKKNLYLTACFFKHSFLFNKIYFLDCFASDFISRRNRFQLTYVFYTPKSFSSANNLFLSTNIDALSPISQSFSNLFFGTTWCEREIFDLFGIYFFNHPDLRRILTDYGFEGFPLRKDFPLVGYTQLRYDDSTRRIVVEPVELSQEYRAFDFKSPWNILIEFYI
jgi:NADH:ubiquinone oxidoreductase subunit C